MAAQTNLTTQLKKFEFFSDFSADELRLIENVGQHVSLKKQTILTDCNEEADYLYLLLEGGVEIILPYADNAKQLHIFSAKPGDFVGWSSLLKPYIYTGQSRILEDSLLMKFEAEDLLPILYNNNHIGYKFMHKISEMISRRLWRALLKITTDKNFKS